MDKRVELDSHSRVAATRYVLRRAAEKCAERGATQEDQAIAGLFAAFDLAERHSGAGHIAISWLRETIDVLEDALVDGHFTRAS